MSAMTRLLPLRLIPRESPAMNNSSRLGLAALAVAIANIGHGELGGNNHGPDLVRYRGGIDDADPWCADFLSYCLEQGAAKLDRPCPVKRSRGAKRLVRHVLGAGGILVMTPAPGDLVLMSRPGGHHVGIVWTLRAPGEFISIEGNVGRYPSRVRDYRHEFGEPHFVCFTRPPWFRLGDS